MKSSDRLLEQAKIQSMILKFPGARYIKIGHPIQIGEATFWVSRVLDPWRVELIPAPDDEFPDLAVETNRPPRRAFTWKEAFYWGLLFFIAWYILKGA